jgi:hypothetical protein
MAASSWADISHPMEAISLMKKSVARRFPWLPTGLSPMFTQSSFSHSCAIPVISFVITSLSFWIIRESLYYKKMRIPLWALFVKINFSNLLSAEKLISRRAHNGALMEQAGNF